MTTPADAVRFIALESNDYDGLNGAHGYGWARATTDAVAAGLGVSAQEAYRLLKAAAKKGWVFQDKTRRMGVTTKRFGESQVGWAIWEVHLDAEQDRARDPEYHAKRGGPDPRAIEIHREHLLAEFAAGGQVTGSMVLDAAAACGVPVSAPLARALKRRGIWVRPRISNVGTGVLIDEACAVYAALSQSGMKPNATYYVWVLAHGSLAPLTGEGPYGPYPLRAAEQLARIGASEGIHDRAVSVGKDPEARGFKIERRYAARSGERIV